jgi:SAM-dependent MidA family methyltransferase
MPFQLINSSHNLHEKLIPNTDNPRIGDRIELSPESLITMDMMAQMVKYSGGGILNIDYGGNGPFADSIRAIKDHKYVPAPYYWQLPGVCDISAYVSFAPLAQYA